MAAQCGVQWEFLGEVFQGGVEKPQNHAAQMIVIPAYRIVASQNPRFYLIEDQ